VVDNAPQPDHIRFLFDPSSTLSTLAGQRRRFASTVEDLSSEELASPSRCKGWTVGDVLRHLVWVDHTIRRIWSGDGSTAADFDPRFTPDKAVQEDRVIPDEEIRERYLLSTGPMLTDLECSDPQRFGVPSLSPAGQVPWWMSAVHIGWDSSIHERDALLPLGRSVKQLESETVPCLAYSLVLMSFFAGDDPLSVRIGTIQIFREAGPVIVETVTATNESLDAMTSSPNRLATDNPVKVIDAICGRGSIDDSLAGDAAVIHRIGGLARYFTSA
jgi:uncharacterized protein (TIGR03083 family)